MPRLFIGLISGTSMDGIDAAVADCASAPPTLLAALRHPFTEDLEAALRELAAGATACEAIEALGPLDRRLALACAEAVGALLERAGLSADAIEAIGSHGQTIRHRLSAEPPFTLQIGDPSTLAVATGITTVGHFRQADVALGGQGAPLAPAFHDASLRVPGAERAVVNLGGIANLTVLPATPEAPVRGFDTGPANTLLDAWAREARARPYDAGGELAAQGRVDTELLDRLRGDPYFDRDPPKSTGPEDFNLAWLRQYVDTGALAAADVMATLAELTAATVSDAIRRWAPAADDVLICGGGVHNAHVMQRLAARLAPAPVRSTADAGLDPDWVEALCFAWLAARRIDGLPGNLPEVTGAHRPAVLGGIFRP